MLGGDITFIFLMLWYFFMFLFYLCLCSCFTNYNTLVMIYIMRLFMVYVFYFMFLCKQEIYFGLLVFSTCVYGLFSDLGIYRLIHLKLLSTFATDR